MHQGDALNSDQSKSLYGQESDQKEFSALIEPIRRDCQDLSSIIEGIEGQKEEQPLDFI